ncbi:MAG: bifunctional diaminohydroxyphosphoribosylaminopyrimidine deaminase/5-amino-6-(5-phosphoribosylamino)uracil reductase RibD [Candidatus Aminicenantes bacterium]|nr:bifunctional diaminohydroxyphosphoribosylaminopyrimidine deaminase/5-amino-6-(5-phosphoribosylamino)uracil reductase RibD [Candidatus Aminicenantes bacterium]
MSEPLDSAYLEMAYGLAEKARGRTSPNPLVGAVLVKDGAIVGTGFHEEAGKPHAEAIALRRAGRRARGSTLYVTLEPCVHWGRTPPCADALIAAGIRRAVISAVDPNPLVNGRGLRKLRRNGVDVRLGLLAERNVRLNEAYAKYITRRVPWVTLKAALSADGRIAAAGGDARWITSAPARDYGHLIRGEHDALLVGIGTLLRDDPRLTIRHRAWGRKPTTRVILDPGLRFPPTAKILSTLRQGPVVVLARRDANPARAKALRMKGVEVVPTSASPNGVDLVAVLAALGQREIGSVLVEGGSKVFTSFLRAGLADKAVLAIAPKLIGGSRAPGLWEEEGAARVRDALDLRATTVVRVGEDIIVEGYL